MPPEATQRIRICIELEYDVRMGCMIAMVAVVVVDVYKVSTDKRVGVRQVGRDRGYVLAPLQDLDKLGNM